MSDSVNERFNPSIMSPDYIMRGGLYKKIKEFAPKLHGDLLDFGCGSKPYKPLFDVTTYTGVDFQGEGHSHENEQIDFFYDGKTLPFENEKFDSVFSSEVFEHVFNLNDILVELNRVLKKGGQILVTCPFAIAEHEVPNDFGRYTSFGLKHLFETNGFSVVAYEKIGTNVDVISQLQVMYAALTLSGKLTKYQTAQKIFEKVAFPVLNIWADIKKAILPTRNDMFLNHIILCEKIK